MNTVSAMLKNIKTLPLFIGLVVLFVGACKQDDYYVDGGKAQAKFDGNIMQYLESKPVFDSVVQVIKLAGLEDTLANQQVTFFAPTNNNIRLTVFMLNQDLFMQNKDTIKTLDEIDPLIWRKHLLRYMFRGANLLKDYPQLDYSLEAIYPGQNYYSLGNTVSRIGVVYNDQNGVRYVGYRQLVISYIANLSQQNTGRIRAAVASSDIQPQNGVVHVLAWGGFVNGG
ncbi:MAG: fasciclin domain-containing protein, partial [Mucilaginibacter polytrichastri]|nr:fasciclin domain-containing protein [Mucilaginibacter polytrichastri]